MPACPMACVSAPRRARMLLTRQAAVVHLSGIFPAADDRAFPGDSNIRTSNRLSEHLLSLMLSNSCLAANHLFERSYESGKSCRMMALARPVTPVRRRQAPTPRHRTHDRDTEPPGPRTPAPTTARRSAAVSGRATEESPAKQCPTRRRTAQRSSVQRPRTGHHDDHALAGSTSRAAPQTGRTAITKRS